MALDCKNDIEIETKKTNSPKISVVIPIFNDVENIDFLYQRMREILKNHPNMEVILVDDGSRDGSSEKGEQIALKDGRFKLVKFKRNYGHRPAVTAGMELAKGDYIITIDSDLQTNPEEMFLLIERLNMGADIACGVRNKRYDPLISRRIPSKIANFILRKLMGKKLSDFGCALNAYRREIVEKALKNTYIKLFTKTFACLFTDRIVEVQVSHRARERGKSAYNVWKLFQFFQFLVNNITFERLRIKRMGMLFPFTISFLFVLILILLIKVAFFSPLSLIKIFISVFLLLIEIQLFFSLKILMNNWYHSTFNKPYYEVEKIVNRK